MKQKVDSIEGKPCVTSDPFLSKKQKVESKFYSICYDLDFEFRNMRNSFWFTRQK